MERVFFNARVRILRNAGTGNDARSFCFRTAEKIANRVQNFVNVCEHLVVPESKDPVASRIQKQGADFIFSRSLCMLGAIEFDDEPSFSRAEVSEVRPESEIDGETLRRASAGLADGATGCVPRRSVRAAAAARFAERFDSAHRFDCSPSGEQTQVARKEQNLESRAKRIARCNRTLTFILSLTGRGEEAGRGMWST